MKHKTSELTGALLDAAVAKAEGWCLMLQGGGWCEPREMRGIGEERIDCSVFHPQPLPWSTDWQHGGPIIERDHIDIEHQSNQGGYFDGDGGDGAEWLAMAPTVRNSTGLELGYGPRPLIAAMRAKVASKFGDEVELP